MSGRASRKKGHRWELDLREFLDERLPVTVGTARSVTGGTQEGSDLVTVDRWPYPTEMVERSVLGWTFEAKDVTRKDVAGWCRQAKADADGGPWVVVRKSRNQPSGDAVVYTDCLGALVEPLNGGVLRWMSLDLFVDLLLEAER